MVLTPGLVAMCWTCSAYVWVASKPDTCAITCSIDLLLVYRGSKCAYCSLCSMHRYWMYAAVRAGQQGILVSNDEMRDHIFQVRIAADGALQPSAHQPFTEPACWQSMRAIQRLLACLCRVYVAQSRTKCCFGSRMPRGPEVWLVRYCSSFGVNSLAVS
jgi:hypothetical protein